MAVISDFAFTYYDVKNFIAQAFYILWDYSLCAFIVATDSNIADKIGNDTNGNYKLM